MDYSSSNEVTARGAGCGLALPRLAEGWLCPIFMCECIQRLNPRQSSCFLPCHATYSSKVPSSSGAIVMLSTRQIKPAFLFVGLGLEHRK